MSQWKNGKRANPEKTTDVYLHEPQVANLANDARVLRTLASVTERRICEEARKNKRKNQVFA